MTTRVSGQAGNGPGLQPGGATSCAQVTAATRAAEVRSRTSLEADRPSEHITLQAESRVGHRQGPGVRLGHAEARSAVRVVVTGRSPALHRAHETTMHEHADEPTRETRGPGTRTREHEHARSAATPTGAFPYEHAPLPRRSGNLRPLAAPDRPHPPTAPARVAVDLPADRHPRRAQGAGDTGPAGAHDDASAHDDERARTMRSRRFLDLAGHLQIARGTLALALALRKARGNASEIAWFSLGRNCQFQPAPACVEAA